MIESPICDKCGAYYLPTADNRCSVCANPRDKPKEKMSALQDQKGGDHYKNLAIQPIEYIHKNGLSHIEGAVVKYITRWRNKNGREDLEKIKHYVDLLIELEGL